MLYSVYDFYARQHICYSAYFPAYSWVLSLWLTVRLVSRVCRVSVACLSASVRRGPAISWAPRVRAHEYTTAIPSVCLSVRLSVCLSVTRVDYIQTAEHIIEILSLSDRPIILVFFVTKAFYVNLMASPLTGAPNTRG